MNHPTPLRRYLGFRKRALPISLAVAILFPVLIALFLLAAVPVSALSVAIFVILIISSIFAFSLTTRFQLMDKTGGYVDILCTFYDGLYAPAGMPPEIVKTRLEEILEEMKWEHRLERLPPVESYLVEPGLAKEPLEVVISPTPIILSDRPGHPHGDMVRRGGPGSEAGFKDEKVFIFIYPKAVDRPEAGELAERLRVELRARLRSP